MRTGRSTDSFKAHVSAESYPEDQCFSVVYVVGGKFRNLDLVAVSSYDAAAWVDGLKALVADEGKEGLGEGGKGEERWGGRAGRVCSW